MCAADLVSQLTIRRLSRNYRNREENNKQKLFKEKENRNQSFWPLCAIYIHAYVMYIREWLHDDH